MFTLATATFCSINDTAATQYEMQILYGVAATFRATYKAADASVNTKVADVTAPLPSLVWGYRRPRWTPIGSSEKKNYETRTRLYHVCVGTKNYTNFRDKSCPTHWFYNILFQI